MILDLLDEFRLIVRLHRESLKREVAPESWKYGEKGDVVLIVGLTARWPFLKPIGDLMNKMGYRIWVHDGPNINYCTIREASKQFEELLVRNDIRDAIVIGHSKGGFVARYFLGKSDQSWRVMEIITISSPHYGSWGVLLFYKTYRDLFPNSNMIKTLEVDEDKLKQVTNYYSRFDNLVIPRRSLKLEGANNVKMNVVGHTRILFSDELRESLRNKYESYEYDQRVNSGV
jgi:hypothetical protein